MVIRDDAWRTRRWLGQHRCSGRGTRGVFVANEAPNDDDVRRIIVHAGRRAMSTLDSFFDNDERRREIDCLLTSLDAASATALVARDAQRAPLSAFIEAQSKILLLDLPHDGIPSFVSATSKPKQKN